MRTKIIKVKFNDAYLYPLSDLHIGDKGFTKKSEEKLKSNIEWVRTTKNAYVCLNGDILNVATRASPSSPFEQNNTLEHQIDRAVHLLKPINDKIVGAIDGNHEQRLADYTGYSPTIALCRELGIDYMQNSALYLFRMGLVNNRKTSRETFIVYCHHTTYGGRTIGGKMNRINMLRDIVSNADVYIGSHNHMVGAVPAMTQIVNKDTAVVKEIRQMIVDSGSYLEWNESYAERAMLPPMRLGTPRIHFFIKRKKDIAHKDIHVSL